MCRGWQEGDHETREFPGMTRGALYMDRCITPILDALNAAGIQTVASCCGHGVRPGNIMLADGREFIIAPDYETARIAEKAFPSLAIDDPERGQV